jgi:ribosomal protein L40E
VPQEELGKIELEWTCRNCGTRNKGTEKTCRNCGSPMAADQQFELPVQQELQTPKKEEATAAPDIHCPWCGARNVASATKCVRCGGDLTGGKARAAGQVLGAYQAGKAPDIVCPSCGTPNLATATQCVKCGSNLTKPAPTPPPAPESKPFKLSPILIGILILAVVLCGALGLMLTRTSDVTATVQDVSWTRNIAIQALQPVKKENWRTDVPKDGKLGTCEQRLRRTQEQEVPGARKVCGTPYVVDQGTGQGKVVQDCRYEIYEDWCQYEINDWVVVRTEKVTRHDLQPVWPALSLVSGREREGARSEQYSVVFDRDGQQYTYSPSAAEFSKFQIGSVWKLKVNQLGGVASVTPQ